MLLSSLAGCVFDAQELVLTKQQVEERTEYTSVPTAQAWVNAPNMRSVLERNLRIGLEQRISLANDTPVPGDNVMMLRTRNGVSGFGRLRFESLIANFGGLPQPFTGLSSGSLVQGDDGVGPYLWASQDVGDVTCILGMRRVNSGMRQLPGNGGIMDIIVRNCVLGSQQDALAPLLADSIGVAPIARDPQGNSRMLSPLAAPSGSVIAIPSGGSQ
ncbi:hypothetical protein [Paracoccus laeviglucosivorans]|nr:hypothetical protein [Paracoccus laeviglucosivorans]